MENVMIVHIVGVALASAIPIIVLIFTLKNNAKLQEKNTRMQRSFLARENLANEIRLSRQTMTSAYNQLEQLLFVIGNLNPRSGEFHKYIESANDIYVLFRQAINSLRFNTDFYQDRKWCDGCTLCEIKIYGDLVKAMTKLRETVIEIDQEVYYGFSLLTVALDSGHNLQKLIIEQRENRELSRNRESLHKMLLDSKNTSVDERRRAELDSEIIENLACKKNDDAKIVELSAKIDNALKELGEKNIQARTKIDEVLTKNKPKLDIAIYDYFNIYKEYAKQLCLHIEKGGSFDYKCKKIDTAK